MTDIVSLNSTATSGAVPANNTSTTSGSAETLNHGTSTPASDSAIDFDQQLVASNVLDDSGESSNGETTISSLSSSSISDDSLVAQSTVPSDVSERLDYYSGRVEQHILNHDEEPSYYTGRTRDYRIEDPDFADDVDAYRSAIEDAKTATNAGDSSIDRGELRQHETLLSVAELKLPEDGNEGLMGESTFESGESRSVLGSMHEVSGNEVGTLAIAKEIHDAIQPLIPDGHFHDNLRLFEGQAQRVDQAQASADELERLINVTENDPSPENLRSVTQATEQLINDYQAIVDGREIDPETNQRLENIYNTARDLGIFGTTITTGPYGGAFFAAATRYGDHQISQDLGTEPAIQSSLLDDALNVGTGFATIRGLQWLDEVHGLTGLANHVVPNGLGSRLGLPALNQAVQNSNVVVRGANTIVGHVAVDNAVEGGGQIVRGIFDDTNQERVERAGASLGVTTGVSLGSAGIQEALVNLTPLGRTQVTAGAETVEALIRQVGIGQITESSGDTATIVNNGSEIGSLPPSANTSSYPIWVDDVGVDANGWREQMRMFRQDTPAGSVFYAEDADGMRYQLDASTQTGAEQEIRSNITHDGFSNPIRQSLLGQLPSSADTTSRPVWTNDVGIDQNGERSMMRIYRQDTTAGSVYYAEDAIGVRYPLDAITQVSAEQEARNGIQYGAYSNPIVQDLPSASSSFSPSIP
ncbi:MAG: hypothetical protein AAGA73_14090, partial [Pseudomonadota bacterium]